jgi:hypothetical protein
MLRITCEEWRRQRPRARPSDGRGQKSGVPVESSIWFVFGIRERKIARVSFHLREAEAPKLPGCGSSPPSWARGAVHP